MGVTWQTAEQKAFIEENLPSYSQHLAAKTLKTEFWPPFLDKWFKRWPLPEPTPDAVEEEGDMQDGIQANRKKKIKVSTLYMLATLARTHYLDSN